MDNVDTIIKLMNAQEARLSKKIDGVHTDVKTQNSRVGKLETSHAVIKQAHDDIQIATEKRAQLCSSRFDGLEIHHRIIKAVNWLASHKKGSLIAGFFLFIMVEAMMHHALAQGWLRQIFQFILKLF